MIVALGVADAVGTLIAGAALSGLAARNRRLAGWTAAAATSAAALFALRVAAEVLLSGQSAVVELPLVRTPDASFVRLSVDGLSAFFLGLVAVLSVLAALYSIPYMEHHRDYGVGRYYPNLLLFVAGMYAIVVVNDLMIGFFLAWHLMTIPSFLLVRFEHRRPESVRAARRYLVMMEAACALVMFGALLAAPEAGPLSVRFDVDSIRDHLPALLARRQDLVLAAFALFFVGFGVKAGVWPFGRMWLPDAHPAAPSPVSALLSGVMIKTGVYGLLRTFLWMIPAAGAERFPLSLCGLTIAALGTVTLFVGTAQALRQESTKRLLAFHSIGQIGYIVLGLGASVALLGAGLPALAAVALSGALFHTLNHALFKGLLFLNAGSILYAVETQDLNRLGGLGRRMPATALTALVASAAIAGVPLTNGFAGKWTIYVACFRGAEGVPALALFGAVAVLTSALTLASFMKFYGVSFLSRTSRLVAEKSAAVEGGRLEVGRLMGLPQMLLAAACLGIGLFPWPALRLIGRALRTSAHGLGEILAPALPAAGTNAGGVLILLGGGAAVLVPAAVGAALLVLIVSAVLLSKAGGAERRAAEPWLCGYARESEALRYGAHNLYADAKRMTRFVGGEKET